jgi:hypothetical protein
MKIYNCTSGLNTTYNRMASCSDISEDLDRLAKRVEALEHDPVVRLAAVNKAGL